MVGKGLILLRSHYFSGNCRFRRIRKFVCSVNCRFGGIDFRCYTFLLHLSAICLSNILAKYRADLPLNVSLKCFTHQYVTLRVTTETNWSFRPSFYTFIASTRYVLQKVMGNVEKHRFKINSIYRYIQYSYDPLVYANKMLCISF